MVRQDVLNKMFNGKHVRITPDFRSYWIGDGRNTSLLGQWFYIQLYHADDKVKLVSKDTHQIFGNVPIKHIKN